jgi:hypothetical protein
MIQVIILVILAMIGENFCFKETYKPLLDNVMSKYESLVELNVETFGPLADQENTIVNQTLESFEVCSLEGEDDEEFMNICLCNIVNCIELYCDLGDFLEFDDCKSPYNYTNTSIPISQKTNFKILYVYDNLKRYEDSTAIGLSPIQNLDASYVEGMEFLIMREVENGDGVYEIQKVSYTCVKNIFESRITKASRWLFNKNLSYFINLISFFSLILILLIFILITELGNQIAGKCWIMFSITSTQNYIHILFLSHYLFNEEKDARPLYFYLTVTTAVLGILVYRLKSLGYGRNWFIVAGSFVLIHIFIFSIDILVDTNIQGFHYFSWMFHCVSYFATEFSIYFWLNMICFDAFYSTK